MKIRVFVFSVFFLLSPTSVFASNKAKISKLGDKLIYKSETTLGYVQAICIDGYKYIVVIGSGGGFEKESDSSFNANIIQAKDQEGEYEVLSRCKN